MKGSTIFSDDVFGRLIQRAATSRQQPQQRKYEQKQTCDHENSSLITSSDESITNSRETRKKERKHYFLDRTVQVTLLSWCGRSALLSACGWKTLLCSGPDTWTRLLGHSLKTGLLLLSVRGVAHFPFNCMTTAVCLWLLFLLGDWITR